MRLAAAAYPLDPLTSFAEFEAKLGAWVQDAVDQNADLLVFPEYGLMELAAISGKAGNLEASLWAVADLWPEVKAAYQALADRHGVTILGASGPARADGPRPVNRAYLHVPAQPPIPCDKQIMTRFERETWDVVAGGQLVAADTAVGRVGVLICYDAEFPLLGRTLAEAGVEILLVPSCTDSAHGFYRVRTGAMARALENQCIAVHAPTVGDATWCPAVDENRGQASIYGPQDIGFPPTGIVAEGAMDAPGWVVADIARDAVASVRNSGAVRGFDHWPEQHARVKSITTRTQGPKDP